MINNSEGLSPTLRPQLGVGFNRALPAPFGFDNGIYPDGVNDYMTIPRLAGKTLGEILPMTIELWSKDALPADNKSLYRIECTDGYAIESRFNETSATYFAVVAGVYVNPQNWSKPGKWLLQIELNTAKNCKHYRNGLSTSASAYTTNDRMIETAHVVDVFYLFKGAIRHWVNPIDELRIYNRTFSDEESRLNYNGGVGENPSKTEGLIAWYKFQDFEMLDFSMLQDGSDMRLGMRDHSGQNNHALPFNMDTNPASPNYVLKPF